jgi:predicted AlkP superfamily pyrophosphatase or phosphodiesterase
MKRKEYNDPVGLKFEFMSITVPWSSMFLRFVRPLFHSTTAYSLGLSTTSNQLVIFSQNKLVTNNQLVIFSQNKTTPATSQTNGSSTLPMYMQTHPYGHTKPAKYTYTTSLWTSTKSHRTS